MVYSFVGSQFAAFCNKEYQGPNFKWENFPNMMSRLVTTQLILNVPHSKTYKQEEEYSAKMAHYFATRLIKEAGFVE